MEQCRECHLDDQPVGSGFSYNDIAKDPIGVISEKEMAEDMYEFLQKFLQAYQQFSALPFVITGESYAGHYIPALSAFIERANQNQSNPKINLQALAIGNGLVDPLIQYRYYAPYALQHKLVSMPDYAVMEAALGLCLPLIYECKLNSSLGYLACINAYDVCNLMELEPVTLTGVNPYDVRIKCGDTPLCYDFSLVKEFLAQPDIMKQLGTTGHNWKECNRVAELELVLAGDWMLNYAEDIPFLLGAGHRVLVYAGEYDFLCNWMGNSAWVSALQWPGSSAYNSSANATWTVNGGPAGAFKTAEGLTFIQFFNAGHMVPMNQPVNALDMITRFIRNETFSS